jgi:hypothetical protein
MQAESSPSSESESSSIISEFEFLQETLERTTNISASPYLRPPTFIYPINQIQVPNMAAAPTHTVLNMPIPKTKLAPETFRGDYSKVKDFIEHYDRLLAQHNVLTHKDRCETITRYCGRREKETIKNIPSYSTPDWTRLREDILKVYDADRDTKRYTMRDVMIFAKRKQRRWIPDLAAWKQYVRSFLRVAGSLLKNNKLTQDEHATYFWKGIPRIMRIRLENRLLAAKPDRNLSTPFTVNEINLAAEALLQRDRFDGAIDDSDDEMEESVREEWSSDSESSDSESEEESRYMKKTIRRRGKSEKKRRSEDSEDEGVNKKKGKTDLPKRKVTSGRTEVEGLIRQLNSMSNEDPGYGLAYYRAVKLDSDVDRVVRAPSFKATTSSVPQQYGGATYTRTMNYPATSRPPALAYQAQPAAPFKTQPPPHLSAANAYPLRPPQPGTQRRDEIRCYGCGEIGHGMSTCQKIAELVNKGVLTRDGGGRIVKSDGSGIRRIGNETFIEAIDREQRPQSHLVTINNGYHCDSSTESEDDSESDSEAIEIEYEDVYVIQGDKYETYAADKTEKRSTAKRREVLDGVYPPPLKRQSMRLMKDKENVPLPRNEILSHRPFPRPVKDHIMADPPGNVAPAKRVVQDKSTKIPANKQARRFDPANDAEIIEDEAIGHETRGPMKQPEAKIEDKKQVLVPAGERKPVPRQSAVSAHVDPVNVMNQLLNTRITLAVGEVLGISRELSSMVSDSIKIKSTKTPSVPVGLATSFRPKTRGLLIKITLECDGAPIEAIIDTGSQLNIVSESVYKSRIRRPIDQKSTVNMNDANGGERTLQGLVKNVPLTCGGVQTEANLYVGEHVPFQMLLGRPWQRGNFVSIDERSDGTYLLFKDPKSLETRYEFLVTPDNMTTMDWGFEPSTWHVTEAPVTSYLIEVANEETDHNQSRLDQIEALIRGINTSNSADRPYSDQATDVTNYGWPQSLNIINGILHWMGVLAETNKEGTTDLERKILTSIKAGRTYKQVPCRFLDTLPEPTNMALNVAAVPISSEVEDLPIIYSLAAPARSEADDLRDALRHEEFMHDQGYFSNVALNSAQAFVTGYHADGQGNRYTAITGLRSVRTAYTGNGPQTVYGHYTARLYTDLDPIPSSVVIPTFLQPTNPDEGDTYWVSRNGDPHVWPDTNRCAEWVDYQPPAVNGLVTDPAPEQSIAPEEELIPPPPTYTPTVSLPLPTQVSRADSDSSTDDENWLPCTRCAKTHGIFGCTNGSQYSLVRISSNGSVSSSVHLLDEPIQIECYVGTQAELRTLNASSGGDGEPSATVTSARIIDSLNATEVQEYNAYRYPQTQSGRNPPLSLDTQTSSRSDLISPISEPPPLIRVLSSDDEELGEETREMQHGVLSLWKEFRKGLSEEQLGRYWGMTPYRIIMGLKEDEVKRLAEAAVATEIETARQAVMQPSPVLSSHITTSEVRSQLTQVLQPTRATSEVTLVNSPIELSAQEARGLASHHRIVPIPRIGMSKRRNSTDSPSTINYRPAECSPISAPEPMAVYAARVAKPFTVDNSYHDPLRSVRSFSDEYPDRNKFRQFIRGPAVWPTVPPLTVYASTSNTPDSKHVQPWGLGAEPISPDSETSSPVEVMQPPPRVQNLPGQHNRYQEMEPVLRPSEERDSPPPDTAARQYEQARIQEHINRVRAESALTHQPPVAPQSMFEEVIVHGDRRPMPTRPNTPIERTREPLSGDGVDQALANIATASQNYSTRVAELHAEKAEEEIQVHIMRLVGDTLERKQDRSEVNGVGLPIKARHRKHIYSRHEYPTKEPLITQDEDSSEHSSSSNSLKRTTTPPQAPLSSITAPPLRSALKKPTPYTAPLREINVAKKPHGHTYAEPLEEILLDKVPLRPREVPMADRPYLPEHDFQAGNVRSRIGKIVALDNRTLYPISGFEDPPTPDAYIRFVTVLTGDFEPYIFPEVVYSSPAGAYDLPVVRATNWGARVDEMFESRAAVLSIIGRVENAMTPAQSAELKRTLITMFVSGPNGALVEATINRAHFFRVLHPYYNPLMDAGQATFLRGASYYFRRVQQNVLADAIDVLLRSPQYDDFYCRKLLEIGCLDHQTGFQRQRALDYIKIYEDEILDEEGNGDDEEDGSMGSDDYELEQVD